MTTSVECCAEPHSSHHCGGLSSRTCGRCNIAGFVLPRVRRGLNTSVPALQHGLPTLPPSRPAVTYGTTMQDTLSVSALSLLTDFEASDSNVCADRGDLTDVEDGELSDSNTEPDASLLPTSADTSETRVYAARYWVLFVYSSVLLFQCVVWNSWGAISASALYAFPSWDAATVALLSNTGCVGLLGAVFPTCVCVQRWGLRPPMLGLMAAWVLALGLRCLTRHPPLFTKAAYVCGLVNGGLAGVVLAVPTVSATWFPSSQRVTATAVSSVMAQAGVGVSFLIPYIVRPPGPAARPSDVSDDIHNLMLIEFGVAAALLVCALAYFPSAPSLPPSPSAAAPRRALAPGFRAVAGNCSFWLLLSSYAVFTGVSGSWISVMAFSLDQFSFTQEEVGSLGLWAAGSTTVVSIASAWLADKFYAYLKVALVGVMVCSSLSYACFLLMTLDTVSASKARVYAAVLAGQSWNSASVPLFLELTCDVAHPAPEAVTGALGVFLSNAVSAAFLLLFSAPQLVKEGPAWISYVLVGSNACVILPVVVARAARGGRRTQEAGR